MTAPDMVFALVMGLIVVGFLLFLRWFDKYLKRDTARELARFRELAQKWKARKEAEEKATVIEKRTKMAHFRVSPSELEMLKKATEKEGQVLSDFLRNKVFKSSGVDDAEAKA